jgi:hypothetical protein
VEYHQWWEEGKDLRRDEHLQNRSTPYKVYRITTDGDIHSQAMSIINEILANQY